MAAQARDDPGGRHPRPGPLARWPAGPRCYGGRAYQCTWRDRYPANAIQVVGTSLHANHSIAASVVRGGTSYTLEVTNSSHPVNSFTATQTCSGCANSSAGWIAGAPSGSSGVYPLSHVSTSSEAGATGTAGRVRGNIAFTDGEITMIGSSGAIKAQPGVLNGSGSSFSVTWERSS